MNFDVDAVTRLAERLHAGETLNGATFTFPLGSLVNQSLPLTWDQVSLDRFAAFAELDERHHQPFGLVHGGVWASYVETVGSVASHIQVALEQKMAVGVHNATDFLRSFRTGRVSIVGTPVHRGRTEHLWQVDISRTDGALVARGQLRVRIISPRIASRTGR